MKIYCKGYSYDRENSKGGKCVVKKCGKFAREGNDLDGNDLTTCETHKHQQPYTDEELLNLIKCGCKRLYHKKDNMNKCEICQTLPTCFTCTNFALEGKNYCGKHEN